MGKILGIKGHSTRGKEVIELLQMMGGEAIAAKGNDETAIYVIPVNGIIDARYTYEKRIDNYAIFTLEEFLERYPFKVHDLVNIPEYESTVGICGMRWDPYFKCVEYMVYCNDDEEWHTAEELLKYNPNKSSKDMEEKDQAKAPDLKGEDYSGKRFGYKIPAGYEFDKIENNNIILKPIKPEYPKTYKECRAILDYNSGFMSGYKSALLASLQSLLVCRDAYWKIAGEEMGLSKPWEPNWTTFEGMPAIFTFRYNIVCDSVKNQHCLLVFPTEEMRNAFCKNFKDLIKQCKELL